ncbi:dTDP-4-dehydrorhamnose 3,5-epimerase family protein [Actinosynnema pretiosum]|uniref:dTDP-4-dehydrorhamnose 3,5-epimerase family protein n=1 Tax=Actinosynnema pretiosum TaxID=42197 RepID=UPI0020A3FA9A|nr:dTDP-4-dehydrorhamnose 3,5-epimerase [Actinosynnema pretiosum]
MTSAHSPGPPVVSPIPGVPGAWSLSMPVHEDLRGQVWSWFQSSQTDRLRPALTPLRAAVTVSRRGALRGIKYCDGAKYVSCLAGRVLEVVLDLREGSPGFGRPHVLQMRGGEGTALHLPAGVGHACLALTDGTVVAYLHESPAGTPPEASVHPLDPALGIPWPQELSPVLSDGDAAAPSLAAARELGLLPRFQPAPQGTGTDHQ